MATTIMRLKTHGYDSWRKGWDAGVEIRRASGQRSSHVYRDASDPNTLVVVTSWPSLDAARSYFLRERDRIAASARTAPEIAFLDDLHSETH
jgi:heme-degrading monooxygenase HmoA